MELYLASGNQHKAEEFNDLFKDHKGIKILSAPNKLEVEENGKTYFENSFKKAEAYFKVIGKPVLADDSGLDVEALPNELGIHSARFGGGGLSDKDRAMLLLRKMNGIENRRAKFTCILCLYLSEAEHFFFEGHLPGNIHKQYSGSDGFGYDPVFVPLKGQPNKTLAEQPTWKMGNSHRAVSSKFLMDFFQSNICQNFRNSL